MRSPVFFIGGAMHAFRRVPARRASAAGQPVCCSTALDGPAWTAPARCPSHTSSRCPNPRSSSSMPISPDPARLSELAPPYLAVAQPAPQTRRPNRLSQLDSPARRSRPARRSSSLNGPARRSSSNGPARRSSSTVQLNSPACHPK